MMRWLQLTGMRLCAEQLQQLRTGPSTRPCRAKQAGSLSRTTMRNVIRGGVIGAAACVWWFLIGERGP